VRNLLAQPGVAAEQAPAPDSAPQGE